MIKRHALSFKHAWAGLKAAFKTQINYRIHLTLSLLSLIGGWYLKISYFEFLIILTLIFLGLAIEMVNTAIEETANAIDKNHREDIKFAKDVSAAAMLIFAMGAFVIGCVIFVPKLIFVLKLF